jgi:hypothetical protein
MNEPERIVIDPTVSEPDPSSETSSTNFLSPALVILLCLFLPIVGFWLGVELSKSKSQPLSEQIPVEENVEVTENETNTEMSVTESLVSRLADDYRQDFDVSIQPTLFAWPSQDPEEVISGWGFIINTPLLSSYSQIDTITLLREQTYDLLETENFTLIAQPMTSTTSDNYFDYYQNLESDTICIQMISDQDPTKISAQIACGESTIIKETQDMPNQSSTIQYKLNTLHPLWGGHNISIDSQGKAQVEFKDNQGGETTTTSGQLTSAELEEVRAIFTANKFTTIKDIEIDGLPDQSSATISYTDKDGKETTVSQAFNKQSPNFQVIYSMLVKIADRIREGS